MAARCRAAPEAATARAGSKRTYCARVCTQPPVPNPRLPRPPPPQRASAEKLLKAYQDHPDAWSRVDGILEKASTQQTKFFALQILESVIKFRWGALPAEQREGIKNYVSNLIIKYATNEAMFRCARARATRQRLACSSSKPEQLAALWAQRG